MKRDEIFNWIYGWCGSCFCMASDEHAQGDCACSVNDLGFDMRSMPPCSQDHCPLLKSWELRFAKFMQKDEDPKQESLGCPSEKNGDVKCPGLSACGGPCDESCSVIRARKQGDHSLEPAEPSNESYWRSVGQALGDD